MLIDRRYFAATLIGTVGRALLPGIARAAPTGPGGPYGNSVRYVRAGVLDVAYLSPNERDEWCFGNGVASYMADDAG